MRIKILMSLIVGFWLFVGVAGVVSAISINTVVDGWMWSIVIVPLSVMIVVLLCMRVAYIAGRDAGRLTRK